MPTKVIPGSLDSSNVFTQGLIAGTGATSLGKAEDAAHTSGDVGVFVLGVRNDSGGTTFGADQDYGPIATDLKGRVLTAGVTASVAADGSSNTVGFTPDSAGGSRALLVTPLSFNGTTWDRTRNNIDGTALASAARTATTNSADLVNYNGRGVHVVIDATAASATPSVVFTIQGKDALSGQYYTILASAAVTGISTTVLKVYPGITAAANASVSDILPRTWRVLCTAGDADSLTYSIGYSIIL